MPEWRRKCVGTAPAWILVAKQSPGSRTTSKPETAKHLSETDWWARQDSNLRPDRYERPALTN